MGQSPPGEFTNAAGEGLPLLNGPTEFGEHHPVPAQYTRAGRKFAEAGDILFCVRGSTTGRMNLADRRYAIGRGIAAIRHKSDPTMQEFLRGVLEVQVPRLLREASGSTFPNVSSTQLLALPYPEITEPEQRSASALLSLFQTKQSLNRRIAGNIEELLRVTFADQLAMLKAARRRKLTDIATFVNGVASQRYPANGGPSLPVVKITQLRTMSTEGADRCSADAPEESRIDDGTLLFSWSGSLEVEVWSGGPAILNQHIFKVTPAQGIPLWFCYMWLRRHLAFFRARAADRATTMGHIQRHHLDESEVLVPADGELGTMNRYFAPLVARLVAARRENRLLSELRAATLKRLVSLGSPPGARPDM